MNKIIKRSWIFVLVFVCLFGLTACENNSEDKALVEKSYNAINLGDLSKVVDDINLPMSDENNASISWFSSNESIVDSEGVVTRPSHGEGNKTVTLTCTIKINKEVMYKEFIVTVLEEELVFEKLDFDTLVGFTDTTLSGAVKFTAIVSDNNLDVYFAMVNQGSAKLDASEIIAGTKEGIIRAGVNKGGFIAYGIKDITADTAYTVYFVIKDEANNVISDVRTIDVVSSPDKFFGGEDVVTLGYLPIYTLKDLEEFARGYNCGDYLFNQNVKLMADIDMSLEYGEGKKNWVPLNYNNDKPNGQDQASWEYQGTFDGNGHTINGLYCHSDLEYVGFFKKFDTKANTGKVPAASPSGRIMNLTFTNVDIQATYNPDCGRYDLNADNTIKVVYSARAVGAVAGYFRGGLIENVKVIGGKVSSVGTNIANCGGLVGFVEANGWQEGRGDVTVTINNCYTDVEVVAEGNCVGGLIGQFDEGSAEEARKMQITNCYTLGSTKGVAVVGGIVGGLRGEINNCVAYGKVEASSNGVAGGIFGTCQTLVKKSEFYETKVSSVAYFGTEIIGMEVYAIGKVVNNTKGGTIDPLYENLYVNSELNIEVNTSEFLPEIVKVSFEDFNSKTNVTGFNGWEVETVNDKNILIYKGE